MKTLGHHGFWGFSSGFDMLEALRESGIGSLEASSENVEPIRILLVHACDIRHILATITRRRRHSGKGKDRKQLRPVHFYMLESPLEVIARNIVMLELLNDFEVPIRQRANIFLEVFGNCKVQIRTGRYLEQLGHELRQLVVSGKGRLEDLVDLSCLRYKERDSLEEIFKSYSRKTIFDMENLRDHRLRGLYEERYDSRVALSDWDYHATIKPQASIIHVKLYKEWRKSGIAFEFGDQEYSEGNRTLMSFVEGVMKKGLHKGQHKDVKGYWGDVVVGPYLSFGIDCDTPGDNEKELFTIMNKDTGVEQHRHHAAEVSVYNLLSILWELETGEIYRMNRKNDIYSGLGVEAKAPGASQAKQAAASDPENPDEVPSKLQVDEPSEKDRERDKEFEQEYKKNDEIKNKNDNRDLDISKEDDFFPSSTWEGRKEGYVFKLGDAGLGYHRDVKPSTLLSDKEIEKESCLAPPPPPTEKELANESKDISATGEPEREPIAPPSQEELVKVLRRAECIIESLQDTKIFPLVGAPDVLLDKAKYQGFFDIAFIGSRAVNVIEKDVFTASLKDQALVCAESAKFIVPLNRERRKEYDDKVKNYAIAKGLKAIKAPVSIRYRDDKDKIPDKMFFIKGNGAI